MAESCDDGLLRVLLITYSLGKREKSLVGEESQSTRDKSKRNKTVSDRNSVGKKGKHLFDESRLWS